MQLSAAGVSKLANHCPSLEILDISKCFNVDDHAIQDVLQVCTGTLGLLDTCTYVHTYIHTYVHTYIHMYIHTYVCIYVDQHEIFTVPQAYVMMYICTYVYT